MTDPQPLLLTYTAAGELLSVSERTISVKIFLRLAKNRLT